MKVYHSIKDVKKVPSGSVVTVGIFDGLHRGHLRIIKTLLERTKRLRKKSVVLTFYPHPSSILHPKIPVPLLSSLEHRLRLLEEEGVDIAVLIRFSESFSKMKPETFVKTFLVERLGIKEMLVGANFSFGQERSGDIKLLVGLSKKYGFKIRRVGLLKRRGRIISSTYIRSLIVKGRLHEAARLLGRPVSILGTVKRGRKRGRFLGFPTANINPHHEAIPPSGVYVVRVRLGNKFYSGILNIGFRPTFHPADSPLYPPEPTIEVHIFNFRRNVYGKDLETLFVKRLRPEKRFKDREGLKKRIILDEKAAKRILKDPLF